MAKKLLDNEVRFLNVQGLVFDFGLSFDCIERERGFWVQVGFWSVLGLCVGSGSLGEGQEAAGQRGEGNRVFIQGGI
jgi:hypothetical protein